MFMTRIDYRALLLKYMANVLRATNHTFANDGGGVSHDEQVELLLIEEEVHAVARHLLVVNRKGEITDV